MGASKLLLLSILMVFIHNLSCYSVLEEAQIERCSRKGQRVLVNVDDYGAKGDGVADESKAFEKTWKETCSSSVSAVFLVPENKNYLLKQLNFTGPCKSPITFMIKGTLEASLDRSNWNDNNRRLWIFFVSVQNLLVTGGGIFNGNGQVWWPYSCHVNKTLPCVGAPTINLNLNSAVRKTPKVHGFYLQISLQTMALTFDSCMHLRLENLKIKNSQQVHLWIKNTTRVKISNLFITAQQNSPNTDGIRLDHAKNVDISNCDIRTGDDCLSIWAGSNNVNVRKIFCGPGHGISIGSLGKAHAEDHVKNVMVDTVTLNGTENGVRIKSWQGGRGYANHITFQNIEMHDVRNPIIIDQYYCDSKDPCPEQHDAVEIKNVLYKNITGTSATDVALKFNCSKSIPCRQIMLQDINLVGEGDRNTRSLCSNVHWSKSGIVIPTPCV